MADLNARIKPKKSSTTGEIPQAADLEVAEIAVNTADGKLFVKHTDNSIKEISGGADITTESIDALSDVDTTTVAPSDGQVLTWVDANGNWEPADIPAHTDAVSSVNGEVGAVELDLASLNDVAGGGDPDFANVQLLLLGEGADTGTTVTDSSSNAFSPTVSSGVTTSATEFKYGSTSLRMTGGRITYSDNAAFTLGSADFTIETWIRTDSIATGFTIGCQRDAGGVNEAWGLWWDQPSGDLKFQYSLDGSNSQPAIARAWSPSANTWYHVALVRSGSDLLMFVDGTQLGTTATITGSIYDSSRPLTVGALELSSGYIYQLTGYMDNFRLTVGVARYTADFTPGDAITGAGSVPADGQVLTWVDANNQWEPTTPSGGGGAVDSVNGQTGVVSVGVDDLDNFGGLGYDGGLVLLAEGADGVTAADTGLDSSPNNRTQSGATAKPTYSTSVVKYGSSSFAFNGTDQSLYFPNSDIGGTLLTDDFTVECWVRFNAFTADQTIFMDGLHYNNNYTCMVNTVANNPNQFYVRTATSGSNTTNTLVQGGFGLVVDTWYHFALCRSGNDIRLFIDGTQFGSTITSVTTSLYNNVASHSVGASRNASNTEVAYLNGYIDEYRVTQSALYTTTFTPTQITGANPVDGQVLTWVSANSQWEPAGAVVSSVNSQTGAVSLAANDITDITTEVNTAFERSFEDGDDKVSAGFMDTAQARTGLKSASTGVSNYGVKTSYPNAYPDQSKRYDVSRIYIYGTPNINNKVIFGGSRYNGSSATTGGGGGWMLYVDSVFRFYGENAVTDLGVASGFGASTWNEVVWVSDWGSDRTSPPIISIWVNGNLVISNVTVTAAYTQYGTDDDKRWASGAWTGGTTTVWLDDLLTFQEDTLSWGMTDATIGDISQYAPTASATDGQVLVYNSSSSLWQPGDVIDKATLQAEVAAATDFADFQARIAAL